MAVDGKAKVLEKPDKKGIVKFFREIKAEVKRITWPTKKDVKKAAVAVAVLCLIYIAYIGVVDYAFKNLFELVFKIK
jgi:preprotein translocase subunit SecE